MSVISTNVNALKGIALLSVNNLSIKDSLEKLTTGYKINKAADNPSDLAIVTGMTSQVRGTAAAIHNAEDGLNLLFTADGAMAESIEIVQRMRELALRGANDATIVHSTGLGDSDGLKLMMEFRQLANELDRKFLAVSFNTKRILADGIDAGTTAENPQFQVGPDNDANMVISVSISNLQLKQFTYNAGNATMSAMGQIDDLAPLGTGVVNDYLFSADKPQFMRDLVDTATSALNHYSNVRANLGVIARRLRHVVSDNTTMNINIAQARSRINDTDFAVETSQYTKLQILMQSGTAILGQVNAQPQSVLQLLQ